MATVTDYRLLHLGLKHEAQGRRTYRSMLGLKRVRPGDVKWAGFAAEHALVAACAPEYYAGMASDFSHDFTITRGENLLRCEAKTRAATRGWTDPSRFDYVVVPTHSGREPVKDVDLVFFCWWSAEAPRRLWLLGYLKGLREFQHSSIFYSEGEPLPRGGWAGTGGEYVVDVSALRPVPRDVFREVGA